MICCIKLPNFIYIGTPNAAMWRHIDFWRWRPHGSIYYFRFPTCWRHWIRKVKICQQTKFRRHSWIHGWDVTTSVLCNNFRFGKTNVRHIGILLPVSISLHIKLPNFIQIGQPTAETWRHIDVSRWRPRRLNTTSGLLVVDTTVFGRLKSTSKPNFVDASQFMAEI